MLGKFYSGGEFPNYMPIRATATKVLSIIDAKIAVTSDQNTLVYLKMLKERALSVDGTKQLYFTIAQAKMLGIVQ